MTPSFQEPHLAELHREIRSSMEDVRHEFGVLSTDQLAWRPDPEAWGVGQCLDHLVVTDRLYLEEFEGALATAREKGRTRRGPFRGGWVGRWFARTVGPEVKTKMSVPRVFKPNKIDVITDDVVDRYLETQAALMKSIEDADGLDLDRTRVRSPVTWLLWFRLGDAYRIVVEHDKRHLAQARRVIRAPGFPGDAGGPPG